MQLHQLADDEVPAPVTWAREHEETAAELLLSLLSFDTQNPPGSTEEIVEWIEAQADEWGLERRRVVSDPGKPNLVVTIPGDGDRTVLYNGHLDTVPYRSSRWEYDPLGERDDDRVYGRGAEDMKGPIASLLLAARAYVETDATPPATLQFALVSDEETGGPAGTAALLERGAVDSDVCIVAETTSAPERRSVTVAERGCLWLTIEAKGRAAHGSRPMLGVNAIDRLDAAIEECREILEGHELSIDPALEPVIEESVDYYAPAMGRAAAEELFEESTVNLGRLNGGEAINSVPERAIAELDVRLTPSADPMDVLSPVCSTLADHERVSVQEVSSTAGTYESRDSPVVDPAVEAMRRVTGDRIYRRCASGGSDARLFRNARVPTVELALGLGNAHATDEHTTGGTLVGNAAIYSLVPYLYA
jgi:succinyl-diaminopimelate desuccinylase